MHAPSPPLWIYPMSMIFTTRKRSLGQGNIFAPVCHSVYRGAWSRGMPGLGGVPAGGCLLPEECLLPGGAYSQGGCLLLGAVCSRGA